MLWLIDWFACRLVKSLTACLCLVPVEWGLWCGRRVGDAIYAYKRTRVVVAEVNLRWAFGSRYTRHARLQLVRETCHTLGQTAVELLRLACMDVSYVDRYVTVRGMAHLDAAMQRGTGIIFLTGHLGNWELSSIMGAIKGYPMVVLAREQKLPRFYRLLVSYREAKGCRVIGKGMALRTVMRELQANRIIGIVGDQGARTQGMRVNFFGRDALSPVGPVELALRTGATVLPTFIHRTRGPYHTIDVEAPLDLVPRAGDTHADTVHRGLTDFMQRLETQVTAHPGQWLWMHKRWKSTTHRRVVVLSDGKPGHVKQSLAVVEALKTQHPDLTHDVVEVQYRSRWHRILAVAATWLPWLPSAGILSALRLPNPEPRTPNASLCDIPCDYVISCGAAMAPMNILMSRISLAKSIVVMRPSLVPLRRFDLVLVPAHDHPPQRANIVVTPGALTTVTPERLRDARDQLLEHYHDVTPNGHFIGVLWGGDTPRGASWSRQSVEQVLDGLDDLCRTEGAALMVTTSRRTRHEIEQLYTTRLASQARCPILIVANQGNVPGAVEGILGAARVIVVSGDSTSMISEAVASGRPVVVVDPDVSSQPARSRGEDFLQALAAQGYIHRTSAQHCAAAIRQVWQQPSAMRPTTWQLLCHAMEQLA